MFGIAGASIGLPLPSSGIGPAPLAAGLPGFCTRLATGCIRRVVRLASSRKAQFAARLLMSAASLAASLPSAAEALKIAQELGLDVPQLEKDMESAEVQQALDEAKDLAHKLGLQGTPLYLIGDRSIPGAPEDLYDQLVANVAEIRKNGCKAGC